MAHSFAQRPSLQCPNCHFFLLPNQTTFLGPFRCPNCSKYLRVKRFFTVGIRLMSLPLAVLMLLAFKLSSVNFMLALVPTIFAIQLLLYAIAVLYGPQMLELVGGNYEWPARVLPK
jgi:hypothetical protein